MLKEKEISRRFTRAGLTVLARNIRINTLDENLPLIEPQSQKDDVVFFEGRNLKRKRIVLLSKGCSVATCTMCPLPNESLNGERNLTLEDLEKQIDSTFNPDDKPEMLTIYTNGNFFSDLEMSADSRKLIYGKAKKSGVSFLTVESLPQFITREKLEEAKINLGETKLVVAIGLQSSDDTVREIAINTTCTKKSFEKTIKLLHEYSYIPQVFLMIKPPFLTETEGIKDVVESVRYLADLGIKNPILCPTRVAPNTITELLYYEGNYTPPWLWSIIEVLKQTINTGISPRVAISELDPESNPDSILARNCRTCTTQAIKLIREFNTTRNIEELLFFDCECRQTYFSQIKKEEDSPAQPLFQRVASFVKEHS